METAVAPEPRAFRIAGGISFGTEPSAEALSALRAAESIGRPPGSAAFLDRLAALTGRDPRPKRRGPKPESWGESWGLSEDRGRDAHLLSAPRTEPDGPD